MMEIFTGTTLLQLARVAASTALVFMAVITYTRIAGLRSFSKMSGFDFAMTVAVGSLIASVSLAQVTVMEGLAALAVLYILQVSIALLRRRALFKRIIDNRPLLLMRDGKMLEENMRQARITRQDILSKLREANVRDISSVRALVLETTGDISVIQGGKTIDPALLEGVRR